MASPGVLRGVSHCRRHVVVSEYTQDWEQCSQNVPGIPRYHTVRKFHTSKPVRICIQCHYSWETDALQFYSMVLNYFLLVIMVEEDESSRLRMAN